jgi:phenylalanine-4-hydroxylase
MLATIKRPFYHFNSDQDDIWRILFEQQWAHVQQRACDWYLQGHQILQLKPERIPNFAELDLIFQQRIGWELISTDVQYSDGQTWFEHLAERKFLITEYIRDRDSLEYTPLPDIFHDAFGHLPMHIHGRYAELTKEYAHLMLECPPEARKALGSIWWYTIEFGFIRERGELKAFGTGLMSSYGEWEKGFSDDMEKRPFDPTDIGCHVPSPHVMHDVLWILDDFDQLEEFVAQQRQKYRKF